MIKLVLQRWISRILILAILLTGFPVSAFAKDSGNRNNPELLSLSVKTGSGQEISLLDKEPISIDLDGLYSFSATFSYPEQIDCVYITSTKEDAVSLLEAQWNGESFTTNGYFNNDPQYLPGKIAVEYTTKTENFEMDSDVNWDIMNDALGDRVETSIISSSDESIKATVDISELLEEEDPVVMDFVYDVFDENVDENLSDWLGVYKDLDQLVEYALDDGNYFLYLDYSDASTYAMILHDVSDSTYTKVIINEAGNYADTLRALSEQLGTINKVSDLTYQFLNIQKDVNQLHDQVAVRSDLTEKEKEMLNQRIDAYEEERLLFTLGIAVIPAVVFASGGTAVVSSLLFNALVGTMKFSSDFLWNYRIGMLTACEQLDTDFSGDGHGIPLTRELYESMEHKITRSGTYYLTGEVSGISVIGANVTICTHGYECNISVYNNASLNLFDCMYEEDIDGNMIGTSGKAIITNMGGIVNIQSGQAQIETSKMGNLTVNGGNILGISSEDGSEIKILDAKVEYINNVNGNLFIDGGEIGSLYNGGGSVVINNGNISKITNDEWGNMSINDGTLSDDIDSEYRNGDIENYGTLLIQGGDFLGENIDNHGIIEIFNGNFECYIENSGVFGENPTLIIYNGIFRTTNRSNIENRGGRLTIKGGDFKVMRTGSNIETLQNNRHMSETTIQGGNFYCEDGICVINEAYANSSSSSHSHTIIEGGTFNSPANCCVYNTGIMTISDGSFTGGGSRLYRCCVQNSADTAEGVLTITGGDFLSINSACLSNQADMTITGGTFFSDSDESLCVHNSGKMMIIDGTFESRGKITCVESDGSPGLTIAGGTFTAPNGLSVVQAENCTILMRENSSIEVVGGKTGMFWGMLGEDSFQFAVAEDYKGGISYYDSAVSEGIVMNREEFESMDLPSGSYLRLESASIPTTEKTVVDIIGVTATPDLVYDGTAQRGYIGTPSSLYSGEYKITYTGIGNTVYGPNDIPPTDSGTYAVKISVPDSDENYTGSLTLNFAIERADITIIADDIRVYTGDPKPTYSYTIVGLVEGDELIAAPTLTSNANLDVPGNYTIVPSGAMVPNEDNYNKEIIYVNGLLTVSPKNGSTGNNSGGSSNNGTVYKINTDDVGNGVVSVSPVYAKKGEIVTITVTPDEGYKLRNISVYDNLGNEIEVKYVSLNRYTFKMPHGSVKINPVFVKAGEEEFSGNLDKTDLIFTDVCKSNYYYDAVLWAMNKGITSGISPTIFGSNENISRAQMVTFLWRAAGSPAPVKPTILFEDIPTDAYYADAVQWAVEQGITNGTSTTLFNPDATCTRAQIMAFLYRFAGSPETTGNLIFADVNKDSYYMKAVQWALDNGITVGTSEATFSPDTGCTRAQGMTFLYRYMY